MVYWSGTTEFDYRVDMMNLSIDQARGELLTCGCIGAGEGFVNEPLFLLGDYYFFPRFMRQKSGLSITGFYVNGRNGTIEYRVAEGSVGNGKGKIPESIFVEVSTLQNGSYVDGQLSSDR